MVFRWLFLAGYGLFLLNLEDAFGLQLMNPTTKSLLLMAGLVLVTTRQPIVPVLVLCSIMIGVSFVSACLTKNPDFSWALYARSITQFIIPVLLVGAVPFEKDRDFLLRTASWAPLFSVAIGAIYSLMGRGSIFALDYLYGVMRLQGSLIAAFLGGLALTGAFAAMQYAHLVNIRYLGVVAINLVIVLLTAARMPIALSVLLCVASFYVGFRNALGLKIVGTVIGGLGAAAFLATFGEPLITRFSSTHMSGREAMWDFLLLALDQHRDFGVGFGHQPTIVPHEVFIQVNSYHAHNDYLRLAVELGFVPSIIFFLLWLSVMLCVWAHPRCGYNPILLLGTMGFAVLCITDNALATTTHFPLLIITAVSCLRPHPDQAVVGESVRRLPSKQKNPGSLRASAAPVLTDEQAP